MKQRNILKEILEIEISVNQAREMLIFLIKESLNNNAGTRKQYKQTCELFGTYPDGLPKIQEISEKGILADLIIVSGKAFYNSKDSEKKELKTKFNGKLYRWSFS